MPSIPQPAPEIHVTVPQALTLDGNLFEILDKVSQSLMDDQFAVQRTKQILERMRR